MSTRGTQVVLYGESGAGKSSLAIKVLRDLNRGYVVTRCTSTSTYEDVIKSGFDKLGSFAVVSRTLRDTTDLHVDASTKIGSEVVGASVTFDGGVARILEDGSESKRVVEYQLTAENLVVALAKRNLTWLIEDFHKVEAGTRDQLADVLKVFSDNAHPRTTVVVLGASETATDVVSAPADISKRVAQIPVPPLDDDQLGRILDDGGRLMNVDFAEVREAIIRTSAGVASVTHALALRCLQELKIETPPEQQVGITATTLREAAWSYASSMQGNMKHSLEMAVYRKRTRKYDNCAIILKAIASLPEHGGTHAEILAEIRKTIPEYPPSNLTFYLVELGTEERGAMIRKTADGRHRFDEPLQHTYAQINFNLDPREGDLFAAELSTQVTDEEKARALAAASELREDLPS